MLYSQIGGNMPVHLIHPKTNSPITAPSASDRATEANHRIANSLTLIASLARMQASGIDLNAPPMGGGEVRLVLEGFGGRIDTVGRLHQLLAQADEDAEVDLAGYLRDISEAVVSALSFAGRTELRFALEAGCIVASSAARSVGLIVAELLTNSIKYAHPTGVAGEVHVECRRSPDGLVVIEVNDDGVGLPEDFGPATDGRLGFQLVRSFADQLGASYSFASNALGLSFMLHMPAGPSA
jgi:two-component sensor histidine kinase